MDNFVIIDQSGLSSLLAPTSHSTSSLSSLFQS
jgi:hypothetical protein